MGNRRLEARRPAGPDRSEVRRASLPGVRHLPTCAGARASEDFWLDAAVLNQLDKNQSEHLTREALLPTGELAAGQKVPAPGISAYITLRYEFGG